MSSPPRLQLIWETLPSSMTLFFPSVINGLHPCLSDLGAHWSRPEKPALGSVCKTVSTTASFEMPNPIAASCWYYRKASLRMCRSAKPQQPLGPISHQGFSLEPREAVDTVADTAKKEGLLKFGPTFLNPYAGYLCVIGDPDGHTVEFSHGQCLGRSTVGSKAGASRQ
jgi:hypothetical protein